MDRATKIVATIGPASREEPMLTDLLLAGVNVARLNFSHASQEIHGENIRRLREKSRLLGIPVTILQDLQGPKIRIGDLKENVVLVPGAALILTTREGFGDENVIQVDYPDLPKSVQPEGRILIDDGNFELRIESIQGSDIHTRVVVGGLLKPNKGLNLPGANLRISSLTEKDISDLAFGLENGVDAVALSFVQRVEDILECRRRIGEMAPDRADTPVIAKLERPEALDNLEEIVHAADGVMVARGDLGVEMSPEVVPIAQKKIIECANRHGRLVITATQMLDSMINNPRPTRAEASDVANAILDGTDAVMLSGETAVGKYPLRSVQMMDAIICQAEPHMEQWGCGNIEPIAEVASDDTHYIAQAARALARDRNVAAIAAFTHSGRTARVMAKMRPNVPILAFTSVPEVYTRLPMYWGVKPFLVRHAESIEIMLDYVNQALVEWSTVQPGQQVVLVCGYPLNSGLPANLALLHTVGR
jgi:pyruvate kinase